MKTNFLFPNRFRLIGWIILVPASILGLLVLFRDFEFKFLNIKVLSLLPDDWGGSLPGLNDSGSAFQFMKIYKDNFTNELAGILFIVGALFVAFSKEKNEDEYISKIRLDSLLLATYITFIIQLFCFLFFYSFTFMYAMIINIFTILIVFIVMFRIKMYRLRKVAER